MLFQFSRTTGLVAGLSIALSFLGAQGAQAAQLYDFTVTYDNGTTGTGSFSISDTPNYTYIYDSYSYDEWNPPLSDFTYTYVGETFTNLNTSFFRVYEYSDSSPNSLYYGSSSQYLEFNFYQSYPDGYGNTYGYVILTDGTINDSFEGYNFNYSTGNFVNVTGFSLTERTTETQSVPEPGTIAGLALTGVGFLATRRKQRNVMAPALESSLGF